MITAAENDRWNIVFLLAQLGADINSHNAAGNTALMIAIQQKKQDIVAKLVTTYKASATILNKAQLSPLMIAAQNNDWTNVILLAQFHANINEVGPDGLTPLHQAARTQSPNILSSMLNLGAQTKIVDKQGKTALMIAIEAQQWGNVALLAKKADVINLQDNAGITALMLATQKKHIPTIKLLLSQKAKPDITNKAGQTALKMAQDNQEIVQLLMPPPPPAQKNTKSTAPEPTGPPKLVETAQTTQAKLTPAESTNLAAQEETPQESE